MLSSSAMDMLLEADLPSANANPRSGRLLAVAYSCDPFRSMESRVGWQRVMSAAKNHQVWVLHGGQTPSETLAGYAADRQPDAKIEFVAVSNSRLGSAYDEVLDLFWPRYRLWHRQAARVAAELHAVHHFHLAHQVNFCSFREPGGTWDLGIPFIWGPIGGTHHLPLQFLSECDLLGGVREVTRAFVNALQMAFSRRVRGAARSAATVFAATHAAERDLKRHLGIQPEVMLETGIEAPAEEPRECLSLERPFRLLWAGRHRTWKALPLLLKALAQLPQDLNYQVQVLGVGASQDRWRRLAQRLGVAKHIEWVGWPDYSDTLPYYAWADAFVFTSLRDTSGTGLLESLAAGTPIIGLDHQGAADIMSPECSMPVAVNTPKQVAADIAAAIDKLARNPQVWQAKSNASKERARDFRWSVLADRMEHAYQRVLCAVPEHDTVSAFRAFPSSTRESNTRPAMMSPTAPTS